MSLYKYNFDGYILQSEKIFFEKKSHHINKISYYKTNRPDFKTSDELYMLIVKSICIVFGIVYLLFLLNSTRLYESYKL